MCEDVATLPADRATEEDLAERPDLSRRKVEGGRCLALKADVRVFEGLEAAAAEGMAAFGRIDIVLANACVAGLPAVPTLDIDEKRWHDVIDLSSTGAWNTIKATVPFVMQVERGGAVIITSSMAAVKAGESTAAYSWPKAGLAALMRGLALEFAPHSIEVNTVHPTTVHTRMVDNDVMYGLIRPVRIPRARSSTRPHGPSIDFECPRARRPTCPTPSSSWRRTRGATSPDSS